jgi:hypothetical protein
MEASRLPAGLNCYLHIVLFAPYCKCELDAEDAG